MAAITLWRPGGMAGVALHRFEVDANIHHGRAGLDRIYPIIIIINIF